MLHSSNQNQARVGYLYILLAGALWGISGIFITHLSRLEMSNAMVTFSSLFTTSIILGVIVWFKSGWQGFKLSRRGLGLMLILGVFSKGLFKMAYDGAMILTGVATGTILLYLSPFFVSIMSAILFKEKITLEKFIALCINLIGCILVVTGGRLTALEISALGVLLGILSGILYALMTIIGILAGEDDTPPWTSTFYMTFFGLLTTIPFAQPWKYAQVFTVPTYWWYSISFALLPGTISNFLFLNGLTYPIEASKAQIVASVEVIVATLVGVLYFKEALNYVSLIGIAIMLASIVLMNMQPSSSKSA